MVARRAVPSAATAGSESHGGKAQAGASSGGASVLVRLTIPGDPFAVRTALAHSLAALEPLELTADCRSSTELILAEVLNNVVEHAYATGDGPITLELRLAEAGLACTVCDNGLPMPAGRPPRGGRTRLDVPDEDLPEGGFGWFLIRTLTRDLAYVRDGGSNRLSFLVPLERAAGPP